MEVSASVGKARSSEEDEVWRLVPVCRVVESSAFCVVGFTQPTGKGIRPERR